MTSRQLIISWMLSLNRNCLVSIIIYWYGIILCLQICQQMFHIGKHLSMWFKPGLFYLKVIIIIHFFFSSAVLADWMFRYCNSGLKPPIEWGEYQIGTLQSVNLEQGQWFKASGDFWQLKNRVGENSCPVDEISTSFEGFTSKQRNWCDQLLDGGMGVGRESQVVLGRSREYELVVRGGQVVCLGKWLFWSCIY